MVAKKKKAASLKTIDVPFTIAELEMLRDIFGVVIPILNGKATKSEEMMSEATVAEYIAAISGRSELEQKLWKKIAKACTNVGVVTGKAAPTFAVSAAHIPALHAYKLEE
jgi:hypothetical protein